MNILGISGSLHPVHENTDGDHHDAAAVMVIDGKVAAAIEEERLNRIKHTDKFPIDAIQFVLRECNLTLADLDQICYYSIQGYFFQGEISISTVDKIRELLFEAFGYEVDTKKIYFVHHHLAHAVSTFYMSGFSRAMVLTIDGTGDGISGLVMKGEGNKLTKLDTLSNDNSLGIYYLNVIYILGYKQFDEYKVMGLAPYGNPATYRDLFKSFYTLLPGGRYQIDLKKVKKVYLLTPRRKKDEPFTRIHEDIAAALQESLEDIVMHMLRYYKEKYNHTQLCLAGGVAHNCTLNGNILYSGLFDEVFVQPVAHDAGCALGAALYRYHELKPQESYLTLDHLYWGTHIGENDSVREVLEYWNDFLTYEKVENITRKTAELIAEGAVVGWVQGRSEFGPRALGNRSIVADPRPQENKDIINAMVKKREGYRPFAPSVLEEYAHEYYDTTRDKDNSFPYMIFVLDVIKDKQELLGAVTHVDGTARIQTVSKKNNPLYWELIDEFRKITGVPILLNTSFNNNAEPIVDSVPDAITCFYTTQLNVLVIGDYIIRKRDAREVDHLKLAPSIPVHNILTQTNRFVSSTEFTKTYEIRNNFDNGYQTLISPELFALLNQVDGTGNNHQSLDRLLENISISNEEQKEGVLGEIMELWKKRFVRLQPLGMKR